MAIGRGSLATVSVLTGRTIAFKHVIVSARKQELFMEFQTLCTIYNLCDSDSFFSIPQPHAFYDPDDPQSYSSVDRRKSPESGSTSRRSPLGPSLIRKEDFRRLGLETAAYAMDQVQPLPLKFTGIVRNLFYPGTAKATAPAPSVCRIYFGKVISEVGREGQAHRFFNSPNFPLDVGRYQKVVDADETGYYPSVEDIAYSMGEMLGRLHGRGYDGRDIEFVLGGRGFSDMSFCVIDFNQVSRY
jgi:hypothetical protein